MGIAVLGPVAVDGTDEQLGRRDRVVLTALAYRAGQAVGADELADALWPDGPPASAPKIVQGCIVRLRKLLGSDAIATVPTGYRLTLPPHEIDLHRFEQQVARARELLALDDPERAAYVLTEACELWRGRPLPDLEEWAAGRLESNRLEEVRRDAEELRLEAMLRSGRHREVLGQAQALVNDAPLRERRWWLLALAQYQGGRQADALRTIHQLRTVLQRELALDPGPDVVALEHAILNQDPSLVADTALPPAAGACPFQGLVPFDVDDAENFFGREEQVQECLHRLERDGVLVVAGPSGCGKSSLVRAGVAAHLRHGGAQVTVITPGRHPMDALHGLPSNGRRPHVLVVDQLEELFTVTATAAERQQFLDVIVDRTRASQVVLALRADRLGDVSSHPGFAALVERALFVLVAMDSVGLRTTIEAPTRQAGLLVEPGLVDLLVTEVLGEPGALPLLSHALRETWLRRQGRTLTVEGYRASGGIRGSVAQSAEAVYQQVQPEERAALRALMLRLVAPGTEGEPVRTRVSRQVITEDQDDLVDRLVASRLVTSDADVVEVAHEALVRGWPRLRDWLAEDVDGQRILHHLSDAAEAWSALGRPDSELYRGVRLAQAIEWVERAQPTLSPTEADYLLASEELARSELREMAERARRQAVQNRRLRIQLLVACLLVLATVVAGLVAVRQARRADDERAAAERSESRAAAAARRADSRRLGARALTTNDISLSILLALAGVRLDDTPETRANLLATLGKRSQLIRTTVVPGIPRLGPIATNPRRGTYAASDGTNRLLIFDHVTNTMSRIRLGPRYTGGHDLLPAFTPDGATLIVGSQTPQRGSPVLLLDSYTGKPRQRTVGGFPGPATSVTDLEVSRDGSHLAATVRVHPHPSAATGTPAGWDRTVALVWDLDHLQHPRTMRLPNGPQGLALSQSGDVLYTSWPLAARRVRDGKLLWRSDERGRLRLDLDRRGTRLAMPEWDGRDNNTVSVVDARDGRLLKRLTGHTAQTVDARFTPDGTLATLATDDAVILWDPSRGVIRDRLDTGQVNAMTISALGSRLATTTETGQIELWDLGGLERFVPRTGTGIRLQDSSGLALPSPEGRLVAYAWRPAATTHARLRFYDEFAHHLTSSRLETGLTSVEAGAWNPDHTRLALAGNTGLVEVRRAPTGRLLERRRVASDTITSLQYADGGAQLVAATASGTVRALDAETLRPAGRSIRTGGHTCCLATHGHDTVSVFSDPSAGRANPHDPPHTLWSVLDLRTGDRVHSRRLHLDVRAAAASPDGRHLAATGVGGGLWLLDAVTGLVDHRSTNEPTANGYSVAYSSDGGQILTTTTGGEVTLWDARSGAAAGTITLSQRQASRVAFMYGDHDVLMISAGGGVYHWNVTPEYATEYACNLAGRPFSTDEWHTYVGNRPLQATCPRQFMDTRGVPPEWHSSNYSPLAN